MHIAGERTLILHGQIHAYLETVQYYTSIMDTHTWRTNHILHGQTHIKIGWMGALGSYREVILFLLYRVSLGYLNGLGGVKNLKFNNVLV